MTEVKKLKHAARGVDKRIVELANEIGLRLFRRDKELWLGGDIQLTFRKWRKAGKVVDATDEERVEMACGLMENILEARKSWGTVEERFRKVWQGLYQSKGKYIRGNYLYHYEPTLDHGWMVRTPFAPKCSMGISLCGVDERIRVEGETFDECLAALACDPRFQEYGKCNICGCEVAPTERLCGECVCEDDGL